jgi:hypothetical protein
MASISYEIYLVLFVLTRDCKLKIWNTCTKQFIKSIDLSSSIKESLPVTYNSYIKPFDLEVSNNSNNNWERASVTFKLAVYLNTNSPEFVILTGRFSGAQQLTLETVYRFDNNSCGLNLVDFDLSNSVNHDGLIVNSTYQLWSLWENEEKIGKVYKYELELSKDLKLGGWMLIKSHTLEPFEHNNNLDSIEQNYLQYVTEPSRFHPSIFNQILPDYDHNLSLSAQIQTHVGNLMAAQPYPVYDTYNDHIRMKAENLRNAYESLLDQVLKLDAVANEVSSISYHSNMRCAVVCKKLKNVMYIRQADISELVARPLSLMINSYESKLFNSLEEKNFIIDLIQFGNISTHIQKIFGYDQHSFEQSLVFDPMIYDMDVSLLNSSVFQKYFQIVDNEHDINTGKIEPMFNVFKAPYKSVCFLINVLNNHVELTENDKLQNISVMLPGILDSAFKNVSTSRFKLLMDIFIVIICINNLSIPENFSNEIVSQVFKLLIVHSKFVWLSKQRFIKEQSQNLEDLFDNQMNINQSSTSVLGYLFQNHVGIYPKIKELGILTCSFEFSRFFNLLDNSHEAWLDLCKVLIECKQHSIALSCLQSLTQSSHQMRLLGELHLKLFNFDKSRVCFERAVGFDPEIIVGYYLERGVDDLAVHFAKLANSSYPNENLVKIIFDRCLVLKDYESAYRALMETPEARYFLFNL